MMGNRDLTVCPGFYALCRYSRQSCVQAQVNFWFKFLNPLLLNFSKGYPLMMKKLSKILACGWSIEANPGLLLAETAQFSEN